MGGCVSVQGAGKMQHQHQHQHSDPYHHQQQQEQCPAQTAPPPTNTNDLPVEEDTLWLENESFRVGLDLTRGATTFHISRPGPGSVSVVNAHDVGRRVQQSVYGQYDGSSFMGNDWRWNPVQAGSQDNQRSRLLSIEVGVTPGLPSARAIVQPRNWAGGQLLDDTIMTQTVTLHPTHVHYRMQLDYTGLHDQGTNRNEVPALYVARRFEKLLYYDGEAPWTGEPLRALYPKKWYAKCDGTSNFKTTEPIAIYQDEATGEAVGVMTPISEGASAFRFGEHTGDPDPHAGPCSYVAPVSYWPITPNSTHEYDVFISMGSVESLRELFTAINSIIAGDAKAEVA